MLSEQRLDLLRRLAMESGRSSPSEREPSGSWRRRRDVLLASSIVREAKSARDMRPGFPDQGKRRPAKRVRRAFPQLDRQAPWNADGAQALCQNCDRVRQEPWASPSLERSPAGFLRRAVMESAFLLPGPAISSGAAIFPNRWDYLPRCIRSEEHTSEL